MTDMERALIFFEQAIERQHQHDLLILEEIKRFFVRVEAPSIPDVADDGVPFEVVNDGLSPPPRPDPAAAS